MCLLPRCVPKGGRAAAIRAPKLRIHLSFVQFLGWTLCGKTQVRRALGCHLLTNSGATICTNSAQIQHAWRSHLDAEIAKTLPKLCPCPPLFYCATALTHLELNEVTGIDDSVMAALRPLTALLHLSVTSMEAPGVTNSALASLAGVAALRHLEWAVGNGLSAQELLSPGGGCDILSRVGTLRFLSLFVAEDVNERVAEDEGSSRTLERSGGAMSVLAVKGGQRRGHGISSLHDAGGRVGGLGQGVGWKAWLQSALPLCHVTHLPAMSKYSVWDDSTWVV